MNEPNDRARAEMLVEVYAASQGVSGREMDSNGDVSFGETGLRYVEQSKIIYGRAYVGLALTQDASPEWIAAYRRITGLLNDPKVGGMYDRAGGYFVLDEDDEAFFLVRRFDVATTTPDDLVMAMDRMKTVAARWTMKWFVEVSEVMHGEREPPKVPVTLDN